MNAQSTLVLSLEGIENRQSAIMEQVRRHIGTEARRKGVRELALAALKPPVSSYY
jgi:hypothetical protein